MKCFEVLKNHGIDFTHITTEISKDGIGIFMIHTKELPIPMLEELSICNDFLRFGFYNTEQDCCGKKFKAILVVDR
ncbi:MAG: hypothetical protein M0R17_07295 [Candidatus Omnitrophica bacterium]|jgi:hypothetical protein|nr:hypothetical protein [Candidatus Omnitrophota bacterium]